MNNETKNYMRCPKCGSKMKKMKRYYLLVVWDDVEPELMGPFVTRVERDGAAHDLREHDEHGLYPLDIVADGAIDEVWIKAYAGGTFDKDDPDTPGEGREAL